MEYGFKRKFDSTIETEVIVPHPGGYIEQDFDNNKKRMRLSVQVGSTSAAASAGLPQSYYNETFINQINGQESNEHNNHHPLSEMDFDYKDSQNNRDEDLEDIPTTSEVINSLRKVILWMCAQGDHNADYIQYLSEVERYAVSKQLNLAQQRKITQYLIRRTQQ
uniref:Protein panstrongylus lignarius n=1 Tax=Rhodnius prolixus TaxID=13249 RepID=A0A4V0Y8S8_RHOPR